MDTQEKSIFIEETLIALKRFRQVYEMTKNLYPWILKLYPVTVAEEGLFFVFDYDIEHDQYQFQLEWPTPMPIPKGILAAFPLDFYDDKISAVITKEAFESLEGHVFILHEFAHCYQWQQGEKEIRKTLNIEKKYHKEKNHMWEINHPFPYDNVMLINETEELANAMLEGKEDALIEYHQNMSRLLNEVDYEYMIWQEWKEGFARYIENGIRVHLGIKTNTGNLLNHPSRVSFYHIGSLYVDALVKKNPELLADLQGLYNKMKE